MKTYTIKIFSCLLLVTLIFPASLSSCLFEKNTFYPNSGEQETECVNAIKILNDTIPFESKPALNDKIEKGEEEVFMIVEESPRFPGCEHLDISDYGKEKCAQQKLLEYIYGNLKYPEDALKKFIEGQVVVQFVIDKDGSIDDIKMVNEIGGGCGEEVVRVIENMNNLPRRWKPGKQRGNRVRVKYTLPVNFQLTD